MKKEKRKAKAVPQRLKPRSRGTTYGTAEAVPLSKTEFFNEILEDILIATIPSTIPSFLVGFGILINKNDTNRLSWESAGLRTELHTSIGRVDSRMDVLSKQMNVAIVTLVDIGNDLDKRVTRLEDKG